jgi:hypothetical protein
MKSPEDTIKMLETDLGRIEQKLILAPEGSEEAQLLQQHKEKRIAELAYHRDLWTRCLAMSPPDMSRDELKMIGQMNQAEFEQFKANRRQRFAHQRYLALYKFDQDAADRQAEQDQARAAAMAEVDLRDRAVRQARQEELAERKQRYEDAAARGVIVENSAANFSRG